LVYSNAVTAQLIDIDADEDLEMFLPSYNSIYYFENISTNSEPSFILQQDNFQNITVNMNITPTFGDIDGDGDYDLLCGQGAIPGPPSIRLYTNQGSPTAPNFVLSNPNYITNPNFHAIIVPVLADIDADGDLDLFIQDGLNHFYFYQNTGSPTTPNLVLMGSQWQGIHQFPYPDNRQYYFTFADMDVDGDLDLLMGSPEEDNLYFYRNQGTPQSPYMILDTANFLFQNVQYLESPSLADFDGDRDYDLLVGDNDTGLYLYRNVTPQGSALPVFDYLPNSALRLSLTPNPANPLTVASFELRVASNMSLDVYDLLGRRVAELASGFHLPGEYRYVWDAGNRAAGMYFILLRAGEENLFEKVVLLK